MISTSTKQVVLQTKSIVSGFELLDWQRINLFSFFAFPLILESDYLQNMVINTLDDKQAHTTPLMINKF